MLTHDTIVACATPPGRGGVAIIRISGPAAIQIGLGIMCRPADQPLKSRHAHFSYLINSEHKTIDEGLVLCFYAPHSFTGEDVVELQCHGGPYVVHQIIERCCQLGARRAEPGEFSLRAFLNNKIDLTQAEAIADMIDAQSVEAAQSALSSLQGVFSRRIHAISQSLLKIRIYVEAAMDFPEEDIDFLEDQALKLKIELFLKELEVLVHESKRGVTLRDGLSLAILGAPNAGKSSLLNVLSGDDTAIVTDIPGTTRDLLKCNITIAGYPLQIVDTAGLRATDNPVEQEGIRRARLAAQQAEHVFFMVDAQALVPTMVIHSDLLDELNLSRNKFTLIINKIDTLLNEQRLKLETQVKNQMCKSETQAIILLSAKTGEGLAALEQRVEFIAGGKANESPFSARQRHISALEQANQLCLQGYEQLLHTGSGELFAEDLKQAHQTLGSITGKISSDDLLGHIFSSFCIGK